MAKHALYESIKQRMTAGGLRSMPVPAWGVTVYFKSTTPHEAALAKAAVDDQDPLSYYHVQLVCLKALDENGKRIFSNDQAADMRHWPCLETFAELAGEMMRSVTVEEAEKNSVKTRA